MFIFWYIHSNGAFPSLFRQNTEKFTLEFLFAIDNIPAFPVLALKPFITFLCNERMVSHKFKRNIELFLLTQYTLSCPQPYKKIKIRIYDFREACYHKVSIYKAAANHTQDRQNLPTCPEPEYGWRSFVIIDNCKSIDVQYKLCPAAKITRRI